MKKIIVIGAGASGLLAAAVAAKAGAKVVVLEKNARAAAKILISGKGRCNLTNLCDEEKFLASFGENARFLRGAFSRFFRNDLISLLDTLGVPTKEERGERVFPQSDNAEDVANALQKFAKDNGASIAYNCPVRQILLENSRIYGVAVDSGQLKADAIVLATGGSSFPKTGSSGDGYRLAKECGHNIKELLPALVPLVVAEEDLIKSAWGTSLKNVRLSIYSCASHEAPQESPLHDFGRGILGKKATFPLLESRLGEMMITHFGLGGPITLLASLAAARALHNKQKVCAVIDLKPALTIAELSKRLQKEIETHPKRSFENLIKELVPLKLRQLVCTIGGFNPYVPSIDLKKEERQKLAKLLKRIPFNITATLPLSVAMVTAGGIDLSEINPKTMESKKIGGLYAAGEVLDIDAETGGFNLQAAFSTGYVAGLSSALQSE